MKPHVEYLDIGATQYRLTKLDKDRYTLEALRYVRDDRHEYVHLLTDTWDNVRHKIHQLMVAAIPPSTPPSAPSPNATNTIRVKLTGGVQCHTDELRRYGYTWTPRDGMHADIPPADLDMHKQLAISLGLTLKEPKQ
jgi:hypothetical protein